MNKQNIEEVTDRVKLIISSLIQRRQGESIVYSGCRTNCGGNSCVLKLRIKNGTLVGIEPDDRYNKGVGREDEVVSDDDLQKNRLQQRGCPMAWVWHKFLYSPNRVVYPLKRVNGAKRGEGRFERISWDEALTMIAEKMKECKEKYGPYSIMTGSYINTQLEMLFSHFGAGIQGWGFCSHDSIRQIKHLVAGIPGYTMIENNDMADVLLNSKMIVLWGLDPTVTRWGPAHQFAYYIKMARERGKPVIVIDPRYTVAAEVLADQWIPIKPGTDMAMMAAIANVLIREDLYNKEFVEKYVEPRGFKLWCEYLMGELDGEEKTPEWAEKICGVPAETIRAFTRLYAKMKPTFLWVAWAVSRKSRGENVARAGFYLQAMMGYLGKGGCDSWFMWTRIVPHISGWVPMVSYPMGTLGKYNPPKMYRANKWAKMVLLLDKVKNGELSTEEYRRIIGWRADQKLPNPNPKIWFRGDFMEASGNNLVVVPNSLKEQIEALNRMELVVMLTTHMTPTAKYADIILPVKDPMFEYPSFNFHTYGGVCNQTFCPGVLPAPGEAKNYIWIYTKLAEKLGFSNLFNAYYTSDENWDEDWKSYLIDCWTAAQEEMRKKGVELPSFEELERKACVNIDEYFDEPCRGYIPQLEKGEPFATKSGKIEFYSDIIGDESQRGRLHYDHLNRLIDNLPCDWREEKPMAIYQPMVQGFEDPLVKMYPLVMLTPRSRYQAHSQFWDNPWLRSDVYRHTVWLSCADAMVRGIRDGDLVRVFNDVGEMVIPAYVTSRIMPGMVVVHHGAWPELDEDGVDRGGCPTILLSDEKSPPAPGHVTGLVQVEKYRR